MMSDTDQRAPRGYQESGSRYGVGLQRVDAPAAGAHESGNPDRPSAGHSQLPAQNGAEFNGHRQVPRGSNQIIS
jgi:hypothetical protein